MRIGIAGKGGTGKTTLAALVISFLLRTGKKPILAVDADANSNLNEALGVPAPETLVDIVDRLAKEKEKLPAGVEKVRYLEFKVREAIGEYPGFDLLVMGRTEGPGCYCYSNNLLRDYLSRLQKNYSFVVMDNEAGLEHLSRRTTRELDILLITALIDRVSLKSAEQIYQMTEKLELEIKKVYLVPNEFGSGNAAGLVTPSFLPAPFSLPFDQEVRRRSQSGQGLLDIPEDSPAYLSVRKGMKQLF